MKIIVSLSKTELHPMPGIISGFAGIGKSQLVKWDNNALDYDSALFDKALFPSNCIEAAKSAIADNKTVLVSTHPELRKSLVDNGMPFILIYPELGLKDEYLQRYTERGSPKEFIDLMDKNWDTFVESCKDQTECYHIVLGSGEYIPNTAKLEMAWQMGMELIK